MREEERSDTVFSEDQPRTDRNWLARRPSFVRLPCYALGMTITSWALSFAVFFGFFSFPITLAMAGVAAFAGSILGSKNQPRPDRDWLARQPFFVRLSCYALGVAVVFVVLGLFVFSGFFGSQINLGVAGVAAMPGFFFGVAGAMQTPTQPLGRLVSLLIAVVNLEIVNFWVSMPD